MSTHTAPQTLTPIAQLTAFRMWAEDFFALPADTFRAPPTSQTVANQRSVTIAGGADLYAFAVSKAELNRLILDEFQLANAQRIATARARCDTTRGGSSYFEDAKRGLLAKWEATMQPIPPTKPDRAWHPNGRTRDPIEETIPFFRNGRGTVLHRIACGDDYHTDGVLTHSCYTFYCGNTGYISPKHRGEFHAIPHPDYPLCKACEAKHQARHG